jgi:hypothetical protein
MGGRRRNAARSGSTANVMVRAYSSLEEFQCPCPGDVNGDGVVDLGDLLALLGAWGEGGGDADLNDDGVVDVSDLLLLLAAWGECP